MKAVKLAYGVKKYIVIQLAHFDSARAVAISVKDEFGIDVSEQQISMCLPDRNPKLAKQWVDLFNAERDKFRNDASDIPLYHRAYRLKELQKLYDNNSRNTVAVLMILKQAAQEEGSYFKSNPLKLRNTTGQRSTK